MPEGEVKDMIQLDFHQLNVKGKYRVSAQGNFAENQMQRKNNHSQRMLSSPNSHIHLPAGNPHKYSSPIPCYIQHLVLKRVSERNISFCMFFGSILHIVRILIYTCVFFLNSSIKIVHCQSAVPGP